MRTPTIFIPHGDYEGYLNRTFGLRGFLEFRNAFTTIGAEASPIYTGITIVRSGTGTRVVTSGGTTTTQVISYSQSHTFDRVFITDLALDFDSATQFSDGSYDETFPTASPADDESLFKHYVFGINRTERFLSDPKRHHLFLTGSKGFTGFEYGTQVINANPPTDLTSSFQIGCPFFDYADPFPTPPDVLPNEYDQWNCSIGVDPETSVFGIDVTGYSATKWRDLRGTYTLTKNDSDIDPSWTSNSVVHTTQWTIF
jgi:hypothetical protein